MTKQQNGIIDFTKRLASMLLFSGLLYIHIWGLDPETLVSRYQPDYWGKEDGMPINSVADIIQTPDGFLWVATFSGLVRFDGLKFTPVAFLEQSSESVKENAVPDALLVDSQGILWIGSTGGLTSFDYRTGEFKTFREGMAKDKIRRMVEDMRGNLWISFFASYLNRFSNGEFRAFDASNGLKGKKINAILENAGGNLLLGSRENGIFEYRAGTFTHYPVKGLENKVIITMHEDSSGVLWIGTSSGLFKVSGNKVKTYTAADGLSNDYVTAFIEDNDRNFWIGTTKGLNRVKQHPDGSIAFESLLKSITVMGLFEDYERNLWVATYESGLVQLRDGKFSTYEPYISVEALKDTKPLSILEDSGGTIWIGTFEGRLLHCRGNTLIDTIEIPAISGTGITAIAQDPDGTFWLGTTGKGVLNGMSNTFHQLTTDDGLGDNLVTSLFFDSRGRLWISTFDGVSLYNSKTRKFRTFKTEDGILGKRIFNVYEDREKNILVASDKGVTVLKGGMFSTETATHYMQDVPVTCIHEDSASEESESVFWMATNGDGLKRLKNGNVTSFTTADGLTTNFIAQFIEDNHGTFWLMSDSGILRMDKSELNQYAGSDKKNRNPINCLSYDVSDGMPSSEFENELSRHSALKTSGGEFWFNTKKGITIVNPGKVPINKNAPPVALESVVLDEVEVPLNKEPEYYSYRGVTGIRFYFTAPTFLSPEKVKFKYRLEKENNSDEIGWEFLPPGKERVARFTSPDPGNYTFRVKAGSREGVWNRKGVSFSFTIKPLFHETLLFKALMLLVIAAMAGLLYYLLKNRPFEKKKTPGEKYKSSQLNREFASECVKKLNRLMETEKVYNDAELSLPLLAEKISVSSHQLSQILNETLNRNFSDYINYYRVEEAKLILKGPNAADLKIASVAFDVGFNTTVAFYNAFKKFTKMTPSQYRSRAKSAKIK